MLPRGFLILCLLLEPTLGADENPLPFWRAKEKVYRRIENGEIIVVVKTGPAREPKTKLKNNLKIEGGGQLRAPASFVYQKALDFESLSRVSGYIKSQSYDREKKILDLDIEAYGYKGHMKLRMKEHNQEPDPRLDFEIIEGAMKGLTGTFVFRSLATQKSEVGITGDFQYDQFPVPKVFLEFGLEVVFQRMAGRLRQYVESEYKKTPTGGS